MSLLTDHVWRLKYTPDDGDLVRLLYVPALRASVRYDRLTGYFSANALALAARGVEGLVVNGGRMRLIVGCTLDQAEVEAISRGEALRATVERRMRAVPLDPVHPEASDALELLAWMVAEGVLDVKVAVPCDEQRRPIATGGLFHEKAGILEDKTGQRIAFNGSLNESEAGWTRNWDSLNVFTSWDDAPRVEQEEANFAKLWADRARFATTLDLPAAIREDLLRFLPPDQPARLVTPPEQVPPQAEPIVSPPEPPPLDLRRLVWGFIHAAPSMPDGGARVGEATCAVTPWPHQVRAFERMYGAWPTRLLIADEVGLGKTVQAGMLIRQAWLAGRAKRILILVPSAVRTQWQIEMREKFNLNVPIYDGQKLTLAESPATRGQREKPVGRDAWHREPILIASSHLMRRRERQPELLEAAEPWDLVVLDEAHHARRRSPGTSNEGGPNTLLRLMRGLRQRTQALLLLTATPMQVHPVEIWDLLDLLGLPAAWSDRAFVRFFEEAARPNPSSETMEWLAALFRAAEEAFGRLTPEHVQRFDAGLSRLRVRRVLDALRDTSSIPRRQLSAAERALAGQIMRTNTPVARLVSRNTRALLRAYYKAGRISTRIADREVNDHFVQLTPEERALYEAVDAYIATTYARADEGRKSAVGFVLTIYRRRLASSFHALRRTLENHLEALESGRKGLTIAPDDLPDEEFGDEPIEEEEAQSLAAQALALEERAAIRTLLEGIGRLPPDSKLQALRQTLTELRGQGFRQAMVFTQFTDTMDLLRTELARTEPGLRIMCFSGRGGEVSSGGGGWHRIGRDEVKRRFRNREADLLLCTDAAAEGLNFQFCGALVNYDMPWNPMRVEQRIGRIDRLGQAYETVRIANLHYADTVEADVYLALRKRIGLFQGVVGRLQPILARLPRLISETVLRGAGAQEAERRRVADHLGQEAAAEASTVFDLDAVTEQDLQEPSRSPASLDMDDLDLVLHHPETWAPGLALRQLHGREYALLLPGMAEELRVSTDPAYVEEHPDNVELWSPGNPLFESPDVFAEPAELPTGMNIKSLLSG